MSSVIEGYNYDIFISYRQKDNKYDGWVTEFVDNLKNELEATFKEEVSVYFDINPHDGLLETHDVDESLKEKLKCLIFIPIISRTYCDPKSFAWEHEFKAFVEKASKDKFGLKLKLPNGNVASRVLPIRIHDLDINDIKECESVLGGVMRAVEFIYKEAGVNRSLTPKDNDDKNLNRTNYRNQINKVALAIKEIISGLLTEPSEAFEEKDQTRKTIREIIGQDKISKHPGYSKLFSKKIVYGILILSIFVIAAVIGYPKLFKRPVRENPERTVALMSFKNLTGNDSNDFLAEMQHEALYQELGKISQVKPLRIVGIQTTSKLEKNRMSVSEFARDARVDYLIEGSLLSTGEVEEIMIRMVQLFPEERLIWANNYTSDRKNILKLYNTISGLIAQKIDLDLLPQDLVKLSKPHEVDPQSYEAYSRGMSELEKSTDEGMRKGLEYLRESVALAPDEAFANAGLALGYLTIAHSALDQGDALALGEELALRALELDSTIAEVHAALAMAFLYRSWKYDESEKHFRRALELNPNLDMAHYHYSWGLLLWGRTEEAIKEHKLAQKYDPYNPLHTAWLGGVYDFAGRYQDAVNEALNSFKIQQDYPVGYLVLGRAYRHMGRIEEAIKMHQRLAELYPGQITPLCLTYVDAGHLEEAEKLLAEIEKKPVTPLNAYNRARIYARMGRKDEAFKWLAYEPHHSTVAWAAIIDDFEPLHGDPRWNEFLMRVNLPGKYTSADKK